MLKQDVLDICVEHLASEQLDEDLNISISARIFPNLLQAWIFKVVKTGSAGRTGNRTYIRSDQCLKPFRQQTEKNA
jgi:hypothetical protein